MGLFSGIVSGVKCAAYTKRVLDRINTTPNALYWMQQAGMSDAISNITYSAYQDGVSVEDCVESICQQFCDIMGV
jgi:hypothetical protein